MADADVQSETESRSGSPKPAVGSFVRCRTWLLFLIVALLMSPLGPPAADDQIATFSIVARDPQTGDLGVGVQSKYCGVGWVVPHARADVGALATQARGNILYGAQGLGLLESGVDAAETLERLLSDDPLRAQCQVGIVSADGDAATYTGDETLPWSGGQAGEGYAVQGNLLAGPEVVDAMAAAFETTDGELASRPVTAPAAGQAAGGDARGYQSAALLVVRAGVQMSGKVPMITTRSKQDNTRPISLWCRSTKGFLTSLRC